jgi:prepilin-type processing-associated H-X9-DG protein
MKLASAQPRSLMSLYVSPQIPQLFGAMAKNVPDLEKLGFEGSVSSLFLDQDGLMLQGTTLVGKEGPLQMAVAAASQAPSLTDAAFAHVPANSLAAVGVSSPAGWLKTISGMGFMGDMTDASNPMGPVIQLFSSALDGDVAVSLRSLLPLPSLLVTVNSADADAAAKKLDSLQAFAKMANLESHPATGRNGEALTAFKVDLGPYQEILMGSQGSYLVGSTDRQTLLEANGLSSDPGGSLASSEVFQAVRRHVGEHPRVMAFVDLRALSGAGMILLESFAPGPMGAEAARTLKMVQGAGMGLEVSADRIDNRFFLSGDPAQVLPSFMGAAAGAAIAVGAFFVPLREQALTKSHESQCESNLKQLGKAAMMYAQDWDEHFPKANKWEGQLKPYLNGSGMLHCPADSQPGTSYAMNMKLSGVALSQITDPAHTVLFYESDRHGDNPYGTGENQAMRHNGSLGVVFADGHVETISRPLTIEDFRPIRKSSMESGNDGMGSMPVMEAKPVMSAKPMRPAKRMASPAKRRSRAKTAK